MGAGSGCRARDRGRGVRLFVFGLGYTSLAFARIHRDRFSWIGGTVQSAGKAQALAAEGIDARLFSDEAADARIGDELARADALLVSIPPSSDGDPVLVRFREAIATAPLLAWIGYLSTIGVYGDHGG